MVAGHLQPSSHTGCYTLLFYSCMSYLECNYWWTDGTRDVWVIATEMENNLHIHMRRNDKNWVFLSVLTMTIIVTKTTLLLKNNISVFGHCLRMVCDATQDQPIIANYTRNKEMERRESSIIDYKGKRREAPEVRQSYGGFIFTIDGSSVSTNIAHIIACGQ